MPAPPATDPLWLRGGYAETPIGTDLVLLRAERADPVLVPTALAAAFRHCEGPAALDEHARRAGEHLRLPASALPTLVSDLASLRARGFFVSWPAGAAVEGAAGVNDDVADGPLSTLAVLTRNRPAALGRCVQSHVAHAARFQRAIAVVIMDSSDNAADREATHASALALAGQEGIRVRYARQEDKQRFADKLAQVVGVDPALVRFALTDSQGFGHDAGANRNALLLGLAGQRFLSSDDDVICEVHDGASGGSDLSLTSASDPTEVTLFESFERARGATPPSTACLLAQHEHLLGNAVGSLVRQVPLERLAFDRARTDLCRLLADGRGRIVVTSSGLLGDSGASYPSFYAWSKSEVRRQLLEAQPAAYAELLESRQLLRVAKTTAITPGPYLMSTHIGIDARQPLVPFFPVFRGQDLAFGTLLKLCSDEHLFAHLPHAVLHVPFEPRRASLDRLWPTQGDPAFAVVLDACLGQLSPAAAVTRPGTPRLRAIGRLMQELSALPLGDLGFLLRSRLAATSGPALSRQLAELRSHPDRSRPWVRDLQSLVEHRLTQLMRGGPIAARDVLVAPSAQPAPHETARLIRQFGLLLECWPELFAEARRLALDEEVLFKDIR